MKSLKYLALVVLGLALAAAAWVAARPPAEAPDVAYVRLDGTTAQLKALRGQVVVVNFWATTCSICVHEMPQLAALHRRLAPRGLKTLSVSMSYDAPASVMSYAERRQLPFDVAIDLSGDIARRFGDVAATPTTFVIDRQGRIVKRLVGEIDFAQLDALLASLLDAA